MSELEGGVKTVFPPLNLHVSVTALTTVGYNDLVPYLSSPRTMCFLWAGTVFCLSTFLQCSGQEDGMCLSLRRLAELMRNLDNRSE